MVIAWRGGQLIQAVCCNWGTRNLSKKSRKKKKNTNENLSYFLFYHFYTIELEKMTPSRPLTHDLFKNFAELFKINITEIINKNFLFLLLSRYTKSPKKIGKNLDK